MRHFLLITVSLLVSACGTFNMMQPGDDLEPGNGMLITSLRGNGNYSLYIENKQAGYKKEIVHETLTTDNKFTHIVLGLPPGNYQITHLFKGNMRNTFFNNPRYAFTVAAGKINYLCDIDIEFEKAAAEIGIISFNPSGQRGYKMKAYRSDETIGALKQKYPKQFAKYEVRDTALPLCGN